MWKGKSAETGTPRQREPPAYRNRVREQQEQGHGRGAGPAAADKGVYHGGWPVRGADFETGYGEGGGGRVWQLHQNRDRHPHYPALPTRTRSISPRLSRTAEIP